MTLYNISYRKYKQNMVEHKSKYMRTTKKMKKIKTTGAVLLSELSNKP